MLCIILPCHLGSPSFPPKQYHLLIPKPSYAFYHGCAPNVSHHLQKARAGSNYYCAAMVGEWRLFWLFTIAVTLASSIAQHSHHLIRKNGMATSLKPYLLIYKVNIPAPPPPPHKCYATKIKIKESKSKSLHPEIQTASRTHLSIFLPCFLEFQFPLRLFIFVLSSSPVFSTFAYNIKAINEKISRFISLTISTYGIDHGVATAP